MISNTRIIKLKTEACSVNFSLRQAYHEDGLFDFSIECVMPKAFTGFYPAGFSCRLYNDDLNRLIQYFNRHRQGLLDGSLSESPVFMPLEGDFQIKCSDGDVESADDGYFSICILFNAGKVNEDASNAYFGFETIVDVLDINRFCEDVKSLYGC